MKILKKLICKIFGHRSMVCKYCEIDGNTYSTPYIWKYCRRCKQDIHPKDKP